jgi:type II secretory pathway component PulF
MIYSIFQVGETFKDWLNFLAPATLVIIAVIITAAVTRGYRGFIQGVSDIVKSKWSMLFFIIVVGFFIYLWLELKTRLGWV